MLKLVWFLVYTCPKVSSTKVRFQKWHILSWSWFLGHLVHLGGKFWAFFAKIKQKSPLRFKKWPKTRTTPKICTFWNLTFVEDTLGLLYTKYQTDWSIFHRLDTFSVENWLLKKERENRKKRPFLGWKSGNFQNFSKILWKINKNHWNTCLVQILAHLDHFWAFCGHLKTHFLSFFLI